MGYQRLQNKYIVDGDVTYIELYDKNGAVRALALIDSDKVPLVQPYRWCLCPNYDNTLHYVRARLYRGTKSLSSLHRLLLDFPELPVCFLNDNRLDNRMENLRICKRRVLRSRARGRFGSSSKYKGVSYHSASGMWQARLQAKGKTLWLGIHPTEEDAALAFNEAARNTYGEYAYQNVIEQVG